MKQPNKTYAESAQMYLDRALVLWELGFSSKVSKKTALQQVTSSYECERSIIMNSLLDTPRAERIEPQHNDLYWGSPHYPHQWKARHSEMFREQWPEVVKRIEHIVEIRDAIKATDVVPRFKPKSPEEIKRTKVEKNIKEIMERRKEKYVHGLELTEQFGGLYVTVNSHYVVNHHGTHFIRNFYYLHEKLTALNTIICVYQKHKDDHPELYPEKKR